MISRAMLVGLVVGIGACGEAPEATEPRPPPAMVAAASANDGPPPDARLLVDQFGYRPADPKFAVVRSPVAGFDADQAFEPGPEYEVRRRADGVAVARGPLVPWSDGAVQASSGDRGWWFDFSALREPGEYYVFDAARELRSAYFRVGENVYRRPLEAATRALFYQRAGFAKREPHAGSCWTDEASYLGPGQDAEARHVGHRDNPSTARDLRGGWFDAGDTNKYVTFASSAVHPLLTAYQLRPEVFGDDFNLPESGNGIPDILDEIDWQIRWLERMQFDDGAVALKVGVTKLNSPSHPGKDRLPRYYVGPCSSSSIAAAAMFAHAAVVYRAVKPLAGRATDLVGRASRAYAAYAASPIQTDCDDRTVLAGDADWTEQDQQGMAAVAAMYLFAATGDPRWHQVFEAGYRKTWPYRDVGWSRYHLQMGDALLYYTTLSNADPELAAAIRRDKAQDAANNPSIYGESADDLYRNYLHDAQYHWGSNSVRASYGVSNHDMIAFGLAEPARVPAYRQRALDTLHYFHGVNPFGRVYLSNMAGYGAERSLDELYHIWFDEKTERSNAATSRCGPAPGYLAGGPNARAVADGVPADLRPPADQPPQKAYRDTNRVKHASWVISEPSNSYQAAYIRLLSALQ